MSEADSRQPEKAWRRFAAVFVSVFAVAFACGVVFIVLLDPYELFPFSLPIERPIISIDQRQVYPQIIRSHRFDSLIVGSSTSRAIDPDVLDRKFGARFANLSISAGIAREQRAIIGYFLRKIGPPKVIMIGLDHVWCDAAADKAVSIAGDFPDWLYDDNRWNDIPNILNRNMLDLSVRLVRYHLKLYGPRIQPNGYDVGDPYAWLYDPARAREMIWGEQHLWALPEEPDEPELPEPDPLPQQRPAMKLPALAWLDEILAQLPPSSIKILAFMPVHIAAQPWPGTADAANEWECKERFAAIGRKRNATVIDMRITSPLTAKDENYWDKLHTRAEIGRTVSELIADAVLRDPDASAENYRVLGR